LCHVFGFFFFSDHPVGESVYSADMALDEFCERGFFSLFVRIDEFVVCFHFEKIRAL